MNISSLIELAKDAAGSYGELAERIGRPASRISDWKAGRRKPDAADIMLLAEVAGRPVFETLAEIEMELDTERSSVWQRALGNLRAAGVAATVVLGATAVVSLTSKPADAAEKAQETKTWRARLGSNQQPLPSEGSTLSIELRALTDTLRP